MARALTVDAVDRTDVTRYPRTILESSGFNGEPGTGSVIVDDVAAALAFPSLKIVRWTEDASGGTKHLYRGRVIRKGLDRGGDVADDARQFTVDVSDSNWDLHRLRVHQWSRPAETGRARVVALGAYILNGASSTVTNANYRATTDIDVTTYVPNTNTSVMDARVYDATDPWAVIDDCARAEGKVFFVFIDDAGDMLLWYDVGTSTSYASTLSITDDAPNLTTEFPPAPDGSPGEEDGSELLSGGALVPAGGILSIVAESRPAIVTAHDVAEETFYDSGADSDAAVRLGFFLDEREDEEFRYSCSVDLPDDKAHLIKAGMTISFRMAAAGVTSPIVQRVVRCGLELVEPDLYRFHLELGFPEKLAGRIRDVGRGVILSGPGPGMGGAPICGVNGCDFRDDFGAGWGSPMGVAWVLDDEGYPDCIPGAYAGVGEGILEGLLASSSPDFWFSPIMWWDPGFDVITVSDFQIRVKWRIIALGNAPTSFSIYARDDVAQATAKMLHTLTDGSTEYHVIAPNASIASDFPLFTWAVDTPYYSQMRMNEGTTQGKVWEVGDPEPGWPAWSTTGTPYSGTPVLGFQVGGDGGIVAIDSICIWTDATDCIDDPGDSSYFALSDDPRFENVFVSTAAWGVD